MSLVITCECGYVVRGENETELLADAHKHMQDAHPDMVGKVTDEQLMSMAQES